MDLSYTYSKIKKIAKEIKKNHSINSMVEIVPFVFSDDDILVSFIREGADLKDNSAADTFIGEAMESGVDYFEIQQEVIEALIRANFYKKELQTMLKGLQVSTEVVQ